MAYSKRRLFSAVGLVVLAAASLQASQRLSDAETERFLLHARILGGQTLPVTSIRRASRAGW